MKQHNASAGFTLLEVVFAFTIFALLMVSAYAALNGIIRAKYMLDDRRDGQVIADAVLTRLIRELQLTYYAGKLPLIPDPDYPNNSAPPSIFFRGISRPLRDGASGDSVTFLALEGGQYLPDGGTHSGLVQLSYEVVPDPNREEPRDDAYVLVRRELPYITPRDRAYERAMIFPIASNVVSLSFRYWDDDSNEWVTEWGERSNKPMPGLVQFDLKLKSPKGRISEYISTVPIRSIN